MVSVSRTLLFTVLGVDGGSNADETKPAVETGYVGSCPAAANATARCDSYQWHLEFHVRDEGSGTREVRVEEAGTTEEEGYQGERRMNGLVNGFLWCSGMFLMKNICSPCRVFGR